MNESELRGFAGAAREYATHADGLVVARGARTAVLDTLDGGGVCFQLPGRARMAQLRPPDVSRRAGACMPYVRSWDDIRGVFQ